MYFGSDVALMRKIADYLTKKRGRYGQKDTQNIGENNGKITK